jgi:hypothetical protein
LSFIVFRFPVPERLKDGIGKKEGQDVLNRFFITRRYFRRSLIVILSSVDIAPSATLSFDRTIPLSVTFYVNEYDLSGVTVQDTQLGAVTLDRTTLAPGESASGVKSYTVQSSASPGWVWYTATGSGVSPTGKTAIRQVSAAVALQSTPGDVYLPVIYANH